MSTRAEQVEACRFFGSSASSTESFNYSAAARNAAATLTRDGELRERLKKLADWLRDETYSSIADDIEALLKETSDEG